MRGRLGHALVALPLSAGLAHANGVIDESPLGGLRFEHSLDIAIAQEDLFLSLKEIRVHYRYHSAANAAQHVNITFPLARLPLIDEPGSIDAVGVGPAEDPRNYMNFRVTVNGRALKPSLREYAWSGQTDVTQTLRDAGVKPFLSNADVDALSARADDLAIKALIAGGLFEDSATSDPKNGHHLFPMWDYQAVYYWPQDFAAGDTAVEIAYVPLSRSGGEFAAYAEDDPDLTKRACIDDTVRKAVKAAKSRPNSSFDAEAFGYIVDTARYWKGPIGRFNLTVEKPEAAKGGAEFIAFCPLDARKVSERQWRWSADDYIPKDNIELVVWHVTPVAP